MCTFNECLAVDLKQIGDQLYILHIIDHLTRYSQGCLIKSKKKGIIVKGLMECWVKIFGPPRRVLSDNGGEFVNSEIVDFAEKFNIDLETTAAESAWSNGLVERHNGVLNDTLQKVIADTNCSIEIALNWAIAAKNCLLNVFGFSPNMLVFGMNPSFPTVLANRPPANNSVTISKYLSDTVNALHSARERFLQQEASEKLNRALRRKTRTYSDNIFCLGDMVYYYRDSSSYWHGPAKIIGKDGKQFLLKQGGVYVRVHPCKLQSISGNSLLKNTDPHNVHSPEESSKDNEPNKKIIRLILILIPQTLLLLMNNPLLALFQSLKRHVPIKLLCPLEIYPQTDPLFILKVRWNLIGEAVKSSVEVEKPKVAIGIT